jgi:hypothetical protein
MITVRPGVPPILKGPPRFVTLIPRLADVRDPRSGAGAAGGVLEVRE